MRYLACTARRRLAPILAAGLLLTGGTGASVVLGVGAAQAAACTGAAVAAGTTCTDTGTLTFTAGSLNLTSPTALTWAATDTGVDQQVVDATTAHQAYLVNDATGSAAGWNVTVSATTFTTGPLSLANTATFYTNGSITSQAATTAPTATCSASTTCTLPTDGTVYPVNIVTATTTPTAYKIYSAAAATGLGSIVIGLPGANPVGWWVNLPGNTKPGTYTSVVTLGVVSAP
jgi:WxL domain surface cell wall-binding